VDGPLAAARVAHVAALQRQDIRELDSLCARFEASGALLIAAECAAEVAVLHTRAGDSRAAAAAGRRSDVLAARCGEPRTPARGRITARAELSPAEQRIAALAAAGHPNREIADRLILSVRTVENTLRRVYLKLGIKARGELPDAL
jgi:DNA-binding CsgD family transcriptional regulator